MRVTKLGTLTVRITGGTDGNGGGTGPVIVLMHGFGASGEDLIGLDDALQLGGPVRFAFPEAPHVLPPSMGGYGRAWWMIDPEHLAHAMMTGVPRDMRGTDPPGLSSARDQVVAMLAALRRELAVPKGGLVLGGFSQGAMLASDVAFRTDTELDALVLLSGSTLVESEWVTGMGRRKGLPTFQSHGSIDGILSFEIAESLSKLLTTAGLDATWVPFRGGHEIPMPVMSALRTFLARVTRG